MVKIVVVVDGGLVADVYSNFQGVEVEVYDLDVFDADTPQEELDEYLAARPWLKADHEGGRYPMVGDDYPYRVYP